MTHAKLAQATLWTAVAVLVIAFSAQQLIGDKAWLVSLDNLHWTIGNVAAAILAWLGFVHSSGPERVARRWFFSGLAAYAVGQVLWDIQVYIGWNPFPAPSDLFYLMLGPGCLLGLFAAMRELLPKRNLRVTVLDAVMLSISILTLTLTVYLPRSAATDWLALGVMTAYPLVLLSAACFGFLMVLHLHPRMEWPWITFQIGLGLQGLVWMWWNVQALTGSTVDGSLLNESFSVASIVLGFSAMHWRMAPSGNKRYEKWCEATLRMLPIFAVVIAALASLLVLSLQNLLPALRETVLVASLVVVLLAALRQSLMLDERQLLLEAEQAVAESSRFLKSVLDTVPQSIFWKDRNSVYLGCNRVFANGAGLAHPDEVIGKTDFDLPWAREESEAYRADDAAVMNSNAAKMHIIERQHNAAGEHIWLDTSKVPLANGEVFGVLGVYENITARMAAEAQVKRLTELYAALSQCNQAIVRCTSEEELFPQICRDVVQFGGMKMAWIGLLDHAGQMVKPVAAFGAGMDYLEGIRIAVNAADPAGRGPIGIVMRENQPYWCQDYLCEPLLALWHERGARAGWGASAALPLHRKGKTIGVFVLYAGEVNAFDEAVRNLLMEMAVDIDYALDNYTLQAERTQAQLQLAASELQLRTIIDAEPECVKLLAEDGTVLQMNAAGLQMLEADAPEQIVGKKAVGLILPQYRQDFATLMRRVFEGESGHLEFEVVGLRGGHRWLETYEVPMRDAQGKVTAMLGITRDVTERKSSEAKLQRLMNLYAALNKCNQAIMRCASEDELFQQVCRDAVGFGGMQMAWIGLVDSQSKRVNPVAAFGAGTEYLEDIRISVEAGDPAGQGTTGTAIREERAVWVQDFQNDPRLAPWHERGADYGWAGVAALPLHRNGRTVGALMLYTAVTDAFDEAARNLLEGMATDISYALTNFALLAERTKVEEELRIAAVTFETQEAIVITDRQANILRVNQAFQDITGYCAEEVIGRNPRILQSGLHDAVFYQDMWAGLLGNGKWSGEVWDKRKNGDIYPKAMTITAVYGDQQQITHYVAVFRDISNRKKSEQEIHQLAFYDPLTKLPNRRLLIDRLQQAIAVSVRNGWHGALLFLDLDHFKSINDTQGHAIGDQLLIEVARRLQHCVREGDSVARLGGDEFVVVLEELSEHLDAAATQTELVAEKIREELGQPYFLRDYECLTTPSIGICLFRGHHEGVDDLLKHADVAMYQAKAAGRNAIRFFDPAMQAILDRRDELQVALRHALQRKQFELYYQIQVDSLRRPLGAEVLLRWKHPERGLVSPVEFIPLAEETGLIVPVGLWVLQTACAQLKAWQQDARTRELRLAVNVSAKQFRQPDFVDQVQAVLLASGAMPSHLKLELTESTVLENVRDTIEKMRALKLIGVSFSMDDFGTGYSSLQYLKQLPLDQIKIDQSFVRDIASDPNDAAIVQTIIAMTDALALNVIAEGVETVAQYQFLDAYGCHSFQGYLFSKPVPLAQFEALLNQYDTMPFDTGEDHR